MPHSLPQTADARQPSWPIFYATTNKLWTVFSAITTPCRDLRLPCKSPRGADRHSPRDTSGGSRHPSGRCSRNRPTAPGPGPSRRCFQSTRRRSVRSISTGPSGRELLDGQAEVEIVGSRIAGRKVLDRKPLDETCAWNIEVPLRVSVETPDPIRHEPP